ncbi:MAG: CvpA family protein, partial [Chloroflexi bacterium]|nr:CvpA family protein [Chloroflexota bacterium]
MTDALTWSIDQFMLLGITLALFAWLGWKRGINRELLSLVGIGAGILMATQAAETLKPVVNRVYGLAQTATAGGAVAGGPAPVSTPAQLQSLALAVFVVLVLVVYLAGQRLAASPASGGARLLGLMAGALNGFGVAYYVFPSLLKKPRAVILLPGEQIKSTLNSPRHVA